MNTGTAARLSIGLLGTLLVLLPFERQLGLFEGPAGLSVTGLEIIWAACLAAWGVRLVAERRLPSVPHAVALALLALLAVNLVSAATADGFASEAFRFVVRSIAGWLLFVAIADAVFHGAASDRLVACLLGGAIVSALIGVVALAVGSNAPGPLAQLFEVGGVTRFQGTFNYPNTAAMYWCATAVCGFGLVFLAGTPTRRAAVTGIVIALAALILLTLSRGAALGFAGGMATAALALLWLHRRRAAVLALAGAGVFVAATIGTQLLLLPGSHLFDEGQEDLYTAAFEAPESVDGRPGETVTVPVVVTNTGQLTWEEALGSNYFLGADWIDVDNLTSIEWADVSATLPDRVAVGESVAVEAHLTLPDAPGVHIAGWNMTNPTGVRFSTYGTPVLTTLVLVGGAEPPTDPGADRVVLLVADIQEPPNRSELWGAAIRMISEKPLQGVGPGTFRLRYGPYIDRPNAEVSIHSNSFILEIASTTGLLGLAAFATLVGFVVVRVIGALRRTILLAFILGALSAFFWAGLVDYFLGFMGNAGLFWSLLGLGLGLATRPSAPSSDVPL